MLEQPLGDVTLLDCSQAGAGPFGAELLSLAGATVIQVEPPGGSQQRQMAKGTLWPNVGQGKKSLELDLRSEAADTVLDRLVPECDVVLHNNPVASAEDLGLDYENLRAIKEDVILCSITGFGGDGPYEGRLAFDSIAQSMTGLMSVTGEPDRKPSRIGAPMIDWGTGLYAALGVLLALRYREATGDGQHVEVSMYETAASFMNFHYTRYDMYGEVPAREGHSFEMLAPYGLFETADGLVFLGVQYDSHWERFCRAFDREEWLDDERFHTLDARLEHKAELYEAVEWLLADYDPETVIEKLEGDVPVAEYRTVADAINDEHLFDQGVLKHLEHEAGEGDETVAVDLPVTFSEGVSVPDALPELGAHTRNVLQAVGFDDEELDELARQGTIPGEEPSEPS